ncbi:MAG: WG repeat-containing protein [Clostridia bacterium]|nr:WG repeat-containing protein [Clostridia bacterium]
MFTRLYELPRDQYLPGCPVLIKAGALLRYEAQGRLLAQMKLASLSEKPIAALVVELALKDVLGQVMGVKEFQYLDLAIQPYQTFGDQTPLYLDSSEIRSYDAFIKAVVFADGSQWHNLENTQAAPLPSPVCLGLSPRNLERYRQEMNCQALAYAPQSFGGLWQCGCGEWNLQADERCHGCSCSLAAQRQLAQEDVIAQHIQAAEARLEAQAQMEAAAQAQRAQTRKARAAKRNKLLFILLPVLLAAIALGVALNTVIIPGNHYRAGQAALLEGQYEAAIQAFSQAGNYQDAREQMKSAYSALGDERAAQWDYAGAENAYRAAGKYDLAQTYDLFAEAAQAANVEVSSSGEAIFIDPKGQEIWRTSLAPSKAAEPHYYTAYGEPRYLEGALEIKHGSRYTITGADRVLDANGQVLSDLSGYDTCVEMALLEDGSKAFTAIWLHKDGAYGLADENGQVLSEPQWFYLRRTAYGSDTPYFSGGMAAVRAANGLYGYINTAGEMTIAPQYEVAHDFSCDVALVRLPSANAMVNGLYTTVEGSWQVIDAQGNLLLTAQGWRPDDYAETFEGGWLLVEFSDETKGYINPQGQRFMNRSWYDADEVQHGYAIAKPSMSYIEILDMEKGQVLGQVTHSFSYSFNAQRGILLLNNYYKKNGEPHYTYTLVNLSGQALLSRVPEYRSKSSTYGTAPFYWIDDQYLLQYDSRETKGLYKLTGPRERRSLALIAQVQWDYLNGSASYYGVKNPNATQGVISVGKKNSYGFIDVNGQLISDVAWQEVKEFGPEGVGFVKSQQGLWGMIDPQGQMLVSPVWTQIGNFGNGLLPVEKDGKWGYVTPDGQMALAYQYDSASDFIQGRAVVSTAQGAQVIDPRGKVLLQGYDLIKPLMSHGFAVKQQGLWQLLDANYQRIY